MEDLSRTIGVNVRKLRRSLGLTQEQLAEQVGIGRHFLSDIETGRRSVSVPTLFQLAEALGVSADLLLGRGIERSHPESEVDALLLKPLWRELREIRPEYGRLVLRLARRLARDFRPLSEAPPRRSKRAKSQRRQPPRADAHPL